MKDLIPSAIPYLMETQAFEGLYRIPANNFLFGPPPPPPSAFLSGPQPVDSTTLLPIDPSPPAPDPEPVHILVIGSRQGIATIVHSLHIKGFAQIHEWSSYQKHRSGRLMRILTRYIPK